MVVALVAPVPPRSSVLPPGAGNEPKKAIKLEEERAKNTEQRYVDQAGIADGDLNAAAVARHCDDDVAAIPTFEPSQCVLRLRDDPGCCISEGAAKSTSWAATVNQTTEVRGRLLAMVPDLRARRNADLQRKRPPVSPTVVLDHSGPEGTSVRSLPAVPGGGSHRRVRTSVDVAAVVARHRQDHFTPAPRLMAIDARSVNATVKRARFAFT